MNKRGPAIAGGVSVLVGTALVASREFGAAGTTWGNWIATIGLVALLLGGAFLLARFVRPHGEEIGEARFDTRHKDERDG